MKSAGSAGDSVHAVMMYVREITGL